MDTIKLGKLVIIATIAVAVLCVGIGLTIWLL